MSDPRKGEPEATRMLPLTVADIAPSDERFVSEGCGAWSDDLAPIAEPGQPFADGTYIVGLDIAPGRYRAPAPSDSCLWLRLGDFRSFTGKYGSDDIRDAVGGWGPTVPGGDTSSIVDIEPTDAGFYSEGCGTWTDDLTPIVTPGQPFPDGTYIVGAEIAPGRYRAREPSAECSWARLGDFSGAYGEVYVEGGWGFLTRRSGPTSIVDIAPEDAGFHSSGCGTWSLDLSPVTVPGEPFPDGTYLVGVDIAPGRYRTTTATEDCLWFRLYNFGGLYGAYEGAFAISIGWWLAVDVAPSDGGFFSTGCGSWSSAATPIAEPGQSFGDGVYVVGIDITPGRYYASSPTNSCDWTRLGSFGGDGSFGHATPDDIIGYGRRGYRTLTIVDILDTDAGFQTYRCGAWSAVAPQVSEPKRSFRDGTYVVGTDIAPGRYYSNAPPGQCNWDRLDAFDGHDREGEIGIGGRSAQDLSSTVVDIKASDVGFSSSGCGEWTQTFTPRVTPGGPPGDGFFLVGVEVAPGRYRAATPESCTFERRSAFSGGYYEGRYYIDEGWAGRSRRELAIVDIAPTDAGFESAGCAWTADLTPTARPGQAFGDGTYVVGPEVAPGRYRARPSARSACEWTRLSKFGGLNGNDTGVVARWWTRGRSAVVDIAPTDVGFHSSGCGEWTPDLSPVLAAGEPFTRGTYLVGSDLPPGRYRAAAEDPDWSCYWARLSGFGGADDVIASSEFLGTSFIVEIDPSDAGFTTENDCGVWAPDSGTPVRSPGEPIDAGAYYVGTEITPGRYRATSPRGEAECRWWRLGGFGGTSEDVLGSYALGQIFAYSFIVDIAATDVGFASTRCGSWTMDLTPVVSPGDPFGSGSWLVGSEVAPGRYRNTPGDTSIKGFEIEYECEWQRVSGFGGSEAETIESGGAEPGSVITVEIAATDVGFVSRGCGVWTPVPP